MRLRRAHAFRAVNTVIDAIACAVVAALAGMGVGGAGLFVLYLTFLRGAGQLEAQASNLTLFVFASVASILTRLRNKELPYRLILAVSVLGVAGAALGALSAPHVPAQILRRVFGAMLLVTGIASMRK
jgi:uncharacterized membrane protein YfcA